MKVIYNQKLKKLARELRNNSTKTEIRLWTFLKNRQLDGYKFSRQKPIGNYIVDFYCNKLKLVIELDGSSHDSIKVQAKDKIKDEYLINLGFSVLRFSGNEVIYNIEGVIQMIQEYILRFEKHTPLNPLFLEGKQL